MIVEKRDVVVVPTDESATNTGMIILVALIALAVAATAWYFSNNPRVIERTTETHDVTPMAVPAPAPAPAPQPAAPQTIIVPQPAAPVAPAPAAQQPAPSANTQPEQTQDQ
jgi:hypothetical protein